MALLRRPSLTLVGRISTASNISLSRTFRVQLQPSPTATFGSVTTSALSNTFRVSNRFDARSLGTKTYPAQRPLMELPPLDLWMTDQAEVDALQSRVMDIQAVLTETPSRKWSIKTGVTIGGKLLRAHEEIDCHDRALLMVYDVAVNTSQFVDVAFVQKLHAVCMPARREGTDDIVPGLLKSTPNLTISSIDGQQIVRYFVDPYDCRAQLHKLLDWACYHHSTMPILPFVTILHYNFVRIAPFPEHNGRVARLLVTLFMLKRGYPPMYIEPADRKLYLNGLTHADRTGDLVPLMNFFAGSLCNTYQELIESQGL